MSHRRIHSQGNIPFSWEEKPGIPKSNRHQKSSSDTCFKILSDDDPMVTMISCVQPQLKNNIAPPPAHDPSTARKSSSKKWKLDDPFLTALKYCSKSVPVDQLRGRNDLNSKGKNYGKSSMMSSVFSCKHSCDIVENNGDNLFKFSKLPPIPKQRYIAKSSFVKNSN